MLITVPQQKGGGNRGIRVFLTDYTIAMVTYYIEKMTMNCLPLIRHLFEYKCWKARDWTLLQATTGSQCKGSL